jgi:hypothetical protein
MDAKLALQVLREEVRESVQSLPAYRRQQIAEAFKRYESSALLRAASPTPTEN